MAPAEVSSHEGLYTSRMYGPVVSLATADSLFFNEAFVEAEVVSHAVPPGAVGGVQTRVVLTGIRQ